jgi:hypothetical protein
MRRLIAFLSTTIVLVTGLITLFGLLVGDELGFLSVLVERFGVRDLTNVFLQLVVVTVAMTLVIGLLNLVVVHLGRMFRVRRGWPYSLVLLVSFFAVVGLTIAERAGLAQPDGGGPAYTAILLDSVEVSIESSLAALLLFSLVYGAYRLMRNRVTWTNLLFTVVLLVVLLGALPLPGSGISLLAQVRDWLMTVPVSAGARGLLLGIALATVVTGVRVLVGQDRSYRD